MCLRIPKFIILAVFVCYQFGVCALLDHSTLVEYSDFIAELAGGETMRDIDCGLVTDNLIELTVNLSFSNRVKSRGRLIKDDERSILIDGTSNGNFLCFTAGYIDTILIIMLRDCCIVESL